jgi:hypothetical protein
MDGSVRFESKLDRASLLKLRGQVDRLLEAFDDHGETEESGPLGAGSDLNQRQAAAYRKVSALWDRLGLNSRTFLSTCSGRPAGSEFTLEDIGHELGVDVKTARAWQRNVSRSLRGVEERLGDDPVLFERHWVDDRNVYRLSPEIQLAIKEMQPGPAATGKT